jgi:site-specific DNA-methyltransferase (adenine-specific)
LKNAAGKVRKSTKGRFSSGEKETVYTAHDGGALPRDVIKVAALSGGAGKKERVDHPTQKPLNLCDTLLKASLNKGIDTLLVVPFAGSGSECVSARKNNINFIGFEINSNYITIANDRLKTCEADNIDEVDEADEADKAN